MISESALLVILTKAALVRNKSSTKVRGNGTTLEGDQSLVFGLLGCCFSGQQSNLHVEASRTRYGVGRGHRLHRLRYNIASYTDV